MQMTSTADIYLQEVADTVMTLALMLARQVDDHDARQSRCLADKCLGLVGFDSISQSVAKCASMGFGMQVIVHSESVVDRTIAAAIGVVWTPSIDDLLTTSNIVSLHDRSGGGERVMTADRLNQLKRDAYLINGSHGDLLDEQAVLHALWFETIGGVGLSVPTHTLSRLEDFEACDNAIILDHPVKRAAAEVDALLPVMSEKVVDLSMVARQRA